MSVEPRESSKLLMGIIGGLIAVVALVVAYQWWNNAAPQETAEHDMLHVTPPPSKTVESSNPAAVAAPTPEAVQAIEENALVKEEILKAPVPENPALAKEEVSRLEDIQAQLYEQKSTLAAQHKDADELIKLKEEQIKLLEAQLAEKP
ncbi:hypothetical protein [Acinetobacter thermotolerans]|uniref:hypothetical protein n=1 Tax=Acinetobacter thermotolerans TaxID=3151487 RepID=UPI00325B2E35